MISQFARSLPFDVAGLTPSFLASAPVSSQIALIHSIARNLQTDCHAASIDIVKNLPRWHSLYLRDVSGAAQAAGEVSSFIWERLSQGRWVACGRRFADEAQVISSAVEATSMKAREQYDLRGKGFSKRTDQPRTDGDVVVTFKGIPPWVKLVLVGEGAAGPSDMSGAMAVGAQTVFRHYVKRREDYARIVDSDVLIPGTVNFKEMWGAMSSLMHGRSTIHDYDDVMGVFLTTPAHASKEVGLGASAPYVDFILHAGTSLLRVSEKDDWCFMMPGKPKLPDWIIEAYETWVAKGSPDMAEIERQRAAANYDRTWNALYSCYRMFVQDGFAESVTNFDRLPIVVI